MLQGFILIPGDIFMSSGSIFRHLIVFWSGSKNNPIFNSSQEVLISHQVQTRARIIWDRVFQVYLDQFSNIVMLQNHVIVPYIELAGPARRKALLWSMVSIFPWFATLGIIVMRLFFVFIHDSMRKSLPSLLFKHLFTNC